MASRENRRSPRTRHDSVLEIFDDSGHLIAVIGRLVNVSSVGLCFSSVRSMAIGAKIHARLRLLKEGKLDIEGRIVWVKKKINAAFYGVEFDAVNPSAKK
jgi:hypothetical protein